MTPGDALFGTIVWSVNGRGGLRGLRKIVAEGDEKKLDYASLVEMLTSSDFDPAALGDKLNQKAVGNLNKALGAYIAK